MTKTLEEILNEMPVDKPTGHKPTEEQQLIIDAALQTKDNLLINALAGAAKTTTLEMICKALPVMPILSLAFNKRIAEEMTKRLPGHVQCRTLNSIGHRVWAQACTGKIFLNTKKSYEILKGKVDAIKGRKERQEAYDVFADTLKAVAKAKVAGYVPEGKYPQARRLVTSEEFFAQFDEDEVDRVLLDDTLTESIRQAYAGTIDFDDQIYMPTLFGGSFPRFPLVMCDEVQDLSAINHAMLEKLVTQRLIAVGDPFQSIYRFRGAQSSGMASLKAKFNMREMGLSISFRCPIKVIENARFRAPHMQWPDWAKEGRTVRLKGWNSRTIEDGAAVICRNNAPLFSLAFRLLRQGRGVRLLGFDIGPNLIRIMKKLGPDNMSQEEVYHAITRWEKEKEQTSKAPKATIADKAECLRVFASFGPTLAEAVAYAEEIFKVQGPITLLSGHKSKGLEWDHVYHLDSWRIPSTYAIEDEEVEQEYNVKYVIETRAKDTLYWVDSKWYGREDTDQPAESEHDAEE